MSGLYEYNCNLGRTKTCVIHLKIKITKSTTLLKLQWLIKNIF